MKHRILVGFLPLLAAAKAFAFLGFGDVVVVASNPAQELLWASEELPKWIEMINKTEQQVQRTKEMVSVVGHPEEFASRIMASTKPVLDLAREASRLKSATEMVNDARLQWETSAASDVSGPATLNVPQTIEILGEVVQRDRERYLDLASEKSLRNRLGEALKKQQTLDAAELALQEKTLVQLGGATTQAEIALHQANITASKQRMELASARTKQAEVELDNFIGEQELEKRKKDEMRIEGAEKLSAKLSDYAANAVAAGSQLLDYHN